MDPKKVESIRSWIANTEEAKRARPPPNVITVRDLRTYFTAVGSPFANTPTKSKPIEYRPAFHSAQASLAAAGSLQPPPPRGPGRLGSTGEPRRRRSARQQCEASQDFAPPPQTNFRACPAGLLIDVRTPSEIDRDEAEARVRQAASEPLAAPAPRPSQHSLNHSTNLEPLPLPFRSNSRRGRRRGGRTHRHNAMADLGPKPQYVPPHMRSRPQYVPPHMRPRQVQAQRAQPHLRNNNPQCTQQAPAQNNVAAVNNGNHLPPSNAFQAARDKWAHQDHPEREECFNLNGGVALNIGAALNTSGDLESSAQTTTTYASPTTTVPVPATEGPQQNNGHAHGWGENQPATAPRAMGNDHGPRKQNLNQGKLKRQEKWVTNKEIRERVMQNGKEPEGVWGSNASDGGFQSNPDGDPNHDIKKLVDWEGNWLPGPTDWESRRSYHHNNFNEEMMRFVDGSIDKEAVVDIYNEPTFLDNPNGEVAPRVWASLSVEGTSLQEWWNNHVGSSLADPESKAWWRSYSSLESSLLAPHEVPVAKVDAEDEEGKIPYLHDLGSGHASDKLIERKNKRKAAKERRNAVQRQYEVAAVASTEPIQPEELPALKPTLSLYIRPALAADAHQIAGIYNHYIQHSIRSPEIDPLSAQALSHRIADETSNAMPWLVACKKGKKNGRGYTNGTDATILGFACASDYLSRRSAFGFAAEAEVYVHHNYLRQKIGSCLMDRLLYVLDPFYSLMDGYQFIGTGPFAEHGGVRVIGSAIMHVSFDKSNSDDIKAIASFLGKFGFKQEGELPNIGVKQERHVSLAIFRYRTGSTIDPKSAFVT